MSPPNQRLVATSKPESASIQQPILSQQRPIIGNQTNNLPGGPGFGLDQVLKTVDLNKFIEQQQRQALQPAGSPNMQRQNAAFNLQVAAAQRMTNPAGIVRPGVPPPNSPLFMQHMVHPQLQNTVQNRCMFLKSLLNF